ncbi:MAG: MFS transporter [Candidatus Methylomirabilota bacterium]
MLTAPFPLLPVLFLTALFFLNFTARVILAPLLPVVETELSIGHGTAGALFLFIQIGYATGLMASGFLSAALTPRRTIVASSLGVGAGLLLMAQSGSLLGIRLSLIVVGAAAGLYLPAGIVSMTGQVEARHWGKALAIHEAAPSLGFVAAPLVAELVLGVFSWRGALVALGAAALLLGIAYARWGQRGVAASEPPRLETMGRLLFAPEAWMMGLFFAVGIGASMGLYTVMPLFLVGEVGMARPAANSLVGASRLLSSLMIFPAGLLVDRVGPRRALALSQVIIGSLTLLLGLVADPALTPLVVLGQSASAVLFFPAGFALISTVFPLPLRSLGVSLAVTMGSLLGAGGLPWAIGSLAETASFGLAFALMGLAVLASPLLLRLSPRNG